MTDDARCCFNCDYYTPQTQFCAALDYQTGADDLCDLFVEDTQSQDANVCTEE